MFLFYFVKPRFNQLQIKYSKDRHERDLMGFNLYLLMQSASITANVVSRIASDLEEVYHITMYTFPQAELKLTNPSYAGRQLQGMCNFNCCHVNATTDMRHR